MASHSPGPAYYNISRTFENTVPVILCKGRTFLKPDRIDAPFYNFPSLVGKVQKVGLHGRTEIKNKFEPPGPNYDSPPFGSKGRKSVIAPIKFGQAKRDPSETIGPGSAKYLLREHSFDATGHIGYTIKGSHEEIAAATISPGPAAYRPHFDAVLPRAPKVAFHDRPKVRGAPETPGYRNLGSTLEGHKFTMKARASDEVYVH
jgi:hypothetical protein